MIEMVMATAPWFMLGSTLLWLLLHWQKSVAEKMRDAMSEHEHRARDGADQLARNSQKMIEDFRADIRRQQEHFEANIRRLRDQAEAAAIAGVQHPVIGDAHEPAVESLPTSEPETDPLKEFAQAVLDGDPIATDAVRDILQR